MGVKSTVTLTRQQAIDKYADLKMADLNMRRRFEAEATAMRDKDLEDKLEVLNDEARGGEGFENYLIRG